MVGIDIVLSIAVLATLALFAGGLRLIKMSVSKKQGWLMIIAAIVLLGNVLILAWP